MISKITAYFSRFFKPSQLINVCRVLIPWAWMVFFICLISGLLNGLFYSPADYQQGDMVRIMYVHVPASWWALGIYTIMAIFSALGLITRIPICFLITKAIAPIGAGFTLISLITGSIWGRPTWGTWWVWDARLTSMLILFFLYIGYINFVHQIYEEKKLSAAALIVVVGWINIPIIKWSVNWWYTLHQPASLLRIGGPAIHPTMLSPLLLMFIAFGAYSIALGCWRVEIALQSRQREKVLHS